jgi:hypothetical protein
MKLTEAGFVPLCLLGLPVSLGHIFADRNKFNTHMNAVSLNNLWTYIQGLSLTASNLMTIIRSSIM